MMAERNLSVIIPVYNVEKYLQKCLESVLEQSFRQIEIIVINDGSTDGSADIIDKYASKDQRIVCINQENGGLSAARNAGLRIATGTYVAFVDSDDWIAQNSFELLSNIVFAEDLDILIGECNWYYNESDVRRLTEHLDVGVKNTGIANGQDLFAVMIKTGKLVSMAPLAIYRRSFLLDNSLFFKDGILHEDELWCPQVLLKANRAKFENIYFYFYRQRDNSITSQPFSRKKVDDLLYIANELMELADKEFIRNQKIYDLLYFMAYLQFLGLCNNNKEIKPPKFNTGFIVTTRVSLFYKLRLIHVFMLAKPWYKTLFYKLKGLLKR